MLKLDQEAMQLHKKSGLNVKKLKASDPACPLITKKVMNTVINQCVHAMNGCMDISIPTTVQHGTANYRNTGMVMPIYRSIQGTSRCETAHSLFAHAMHVHKNYRTIIYNYRSLWTVTNFNRNKLKGLGKHALDKGVAPKESFSHVQLNPASDMHFEFDYLHKVLSDTDKTFAIANKQVKLDESPLPSDDVMNFNLVIENDIEAEIDDADAEKSTNNALPVASKPLEKHSITK